MKVARPVLRGGKLASAYLSQLETQVVLTINTKEHFIAFSPGKYDRKIKTQRN